MTKELVEARLEELKKQRQQLMDNANAFTGAIQDCEHWLTLLTQSSNATSPVPNTAEENK